MTGGSRTPDAASNDAGRRLSPTRTATEMFLRELLRRWRSLLFMLLMPTAYFVLSYAISDPTAQVPLVGEAVRVADRDLKALYLSVLGISVSGAFAALTTVRGSASALRRLQVVGFRAGQLLTARLLVLLCITVGSAAVFLAIFVPLIGPRHPVPAALALLEVGLLGVGLGTLLGMLFTREFEAAMIVVAVSGIQLAVGRSDSPGAERYLLYTPAIDTLKGATFGASADFGALAVGAGYAVALFALSYLIFAVRTRVRPPARR
jgi:hypothetical protein